VAATAGLGLCRELPCCSVKDGGSELIHVLSSRFLHGLHEIPFN